MRYTRFLLLCSLILFCCLVGCAGSSPTQGGNAAGARAYFTTDGGATWEFDTTTIDGVFFATSSIADGQINVVGGVNINDGIILHLAREDDSWHVDTTIPGGLGGHILHDITTNLPRYEVGIGSVGIAVGTGIVLRTTNGGEEWNQVSIPSSSDPRSVSFATTTLGMIAAGSQILRTTNSGISWSAISTPLDSNQNPLSVLQITPISASVWIAPASNGVIRSTDGGLTWSYQQIRIFDGSLYRDVDNIKFMAAGPGGHVIAVSDSIIYSSSDSGVTWARRFTGSTGERCTALNYTFNGAFVPVYNGNQTRFVLVSHDDGESWGSAGPLVTPGRINGLYFFDGNIGNAVGD